MSSPTRPLRFPGPLLAALLPLACTGVDPNVGPLPDRCTLPAESGACEAAIPRWRYDASSEGCVQFTYGGCGGNENNFETREACEAGCGVPEPVSCGGWSGLTCGADEFCGYERDGCDYADSSGTCQARPEACTEEYDPVCGCDGKTYGNRCAAQAAGMDAAFPGVCRGACSASDCGPAPGAPNYVCEDGSVAGPVCERVEGFCGWQIRECPASGASCPDASRDAIVMTGHRTFGFCAEGCRNTLIIGASSSGAAAACDVVSVEVCDNGDDRACTQHIGVLSPAGHDEARAVARDLQGVALDDVYGCPDCLDGGAAGVTLQRRGFITEHTYEFGAPPEALVAANALVQGLIDDLRACRASARVTPDSSCNPR